MHYSTMIAVGIPPVEEDVEVNQEIEIRIKVLKAFSSEKHRFMREIALDRLESLRTSFAREVDGAVTLAMEPYYSGTDDPAYLEFEDRTEEAKQEYETETADCIKLSNGKLMPLDSHSIWQKYEIVDGKVYERNWGPLHHRKRTKKAKRMVAYPAYPYRKLYPSLESFVENEKWYSYCEEKEAYGYYYNPNSFYDWYSIGGRWPELFLVREDCRECSIGEPSSFGRKESSPAPEGYRWVCAARKKDIAWDVMREWHIQKAKEQFHKFEDMFQSGKEPEDSDFQITEQGVRYWGGILYHKGETEEQYLERLGFAHKDRKFMMDLYAFLEDGVWQCKEELTIDSETSEYSLWKKPEWWRYVDEYIDSQPEDAVLVGIDCHM